MIMKIEKINDNQIRCTLTHADLAERQLHLSELAYGTEKAKSLFHDMMQQAAFEFGFEADDIPLMIEAIPASSDSIVLIITKVEDPEELDTRFSKFAPSQEGDSSEKRYEALDKLEGADSLLDLLGKVKEKMETKDTAPPKKCRRNRQITQLFVSFHSERWIMYSWQPVCLTGCIMVPIPYIRIRQKIYSFLPSPNRSIPTMILIESVIC